MRQTGPLALILALLAPALASGQTARLVEDIGQGNSFNNAHPRDVHAALGKAFFTATEPGTGSELWLTDGTDSGTRLPRDVCPGPCDSDPDILGSVPGALLWTTDMAGEHPRLWRTDGTRAGTFPLTGPGSGSGIFDIGEAGLFHGGHFYFPGCTPHPEEECGLWKTDGTGTQEVARTLSSVTSIATFGNRLAFHSGSTLWLSDGTSGGTAAVKRFDVGHIESFTVAGGRIFLVLDTSGQAGQVPPGEELWASDGTESGTRLLKKLTFESAYDTWLKPGAAGVYFTVGRGTDEDEEETWFSDGTPEGTRLVSRHWVLYPDQLEEVQGRLVFRDDDGLFAATADPDQVQELLPASADLDFFLLKVGDRLLFGAGLDGFDRELWSTDGTPAGTRVVVDLCPGSCRGLAGRPSLWPGGILFSGPDGNLWTSDGTAQGTRRLTRMPAGHELHAYDEPRAARLGDRLFFGANSDYGSELWVSRGPDDTRLVTNIAGDGPGSDPEDLLALGDRLFFTACDGFERTVWRTAGEPGSTASLGSATGGQCGFYEEPDEIAAAGGQVFFRKEDGSLWRTDGTAAGTRRLASSVFPGLTEFQGRLVFAVQQEEGYGIWRTDGTAAGTQKMLDSPSGAGFPQYLTGLGPDLYFAAYDLTDNKTGIWRSDGTLAGTRRVALLDGDYVDGFGETPAFTRVGARVYFAGTDNEAVWRTDGTEAGTVELQLPTDRYAGVAGLTPHQGALYFLASQSGQRGLWRTDGTVAGTVAVRLFSDDETHENFPSTLASAGGRLFFDADDGIHGIELWASDGTPAGTALVRDLFAGPESSRPRQMAAAGGALFFSATDGIHGFELWRSDGTGGGTKQVQDIAPLAPSSHPAQLTPAGSRLYFTADDGVTGRELWVLPLEETGCRPSAANLCLRGGRFRVEATWRDFQGNEGTGRAVSLTGDTGYFWFFDEDNVEVIAKVLDGRGVNGHHWVFYGALSNVEYTLKVTDTQTGLTRRYFNPLGQFGSVGDTTGFGPLGAFSRTGPAPLVLAEERTDPAAATGACDANGQRLCLNGGRFAVQTSWKDFQGNTGKGAAVGLTGDTGYFWFFDKDNVEVVVKVLDGTGLNGRHWVFYGALSNVEYTVTVTDTQTGKVRTYRNPSGRFGSVGDTGAF